MMSKGVSTDESVIDLTSGIGSNGGESTASTSNIPVVSGKSISSLTHSITKKEMPAMISSQTKSTNNTNPKSTNVPNHKYETTYLNRLNQTHRTNVSANADNASGLGDKCDDFEFKVPPEAPVFHPTAEEFKNPLAYISKIRPLAEKYGICKIVPPNIWQPPFTVDVDKLRFTPRVQRLNELEAKTRIKLNFLDQIAKFWELQGSSLKIPMVERKALDLYTLHRFVQEEGGLEATTKDRKWSRIACRLGYPQGKSVGTILKGHYERILYPFDVYTSGKIVDSKLEGEQSDDCDYKPHCIISRQAVKPPVETTARRSKRLQTPEKANNSFPHNFLIASPTKSSQLTDYVHNPGLQAEDVKSVVPDLSKLTRARVDLDSSFKSQSSENDASELDQQANLDDNNVELRRLQIHGAGPKMAGVKVGSNSKVNENIKSRMSCAPTFVSPSPLIRNDKKTPNTSPSNAASPFVEPASILFPLDPLAKYICHICNRGDMEEDMLLCDGCDDSYHTFCLTPPLTEVPKGEWRCPKCVVEEVHKPVEAFGFEQAQREYTLQQFGEMADHFKADYFQMPVHLVPSDLLEKEYWRIVSSIDEDVTVEYGADLHTMDHGSGFPTKSSLYLLPADQEYAESNWNLNNLPVLEESVLGHINADISGMKVPWMYVGMCFATFCWHNEDHWSYSINYLHWGEPKTWYGVPGHLADKFEQTMKSVAPELFHSQPDLLHQLVTIMNPNTLMNADVPVYRTDQHAGEFIVTFPRAYHAGFNQGYNFAEAVNFATADWLKIGRECVNHYSKLRRFCVFSHDELVCKMALEPDRLNLGIATACYIDMAEMVEREKSMRKAILEWGVSKAEREAFELLPDDARQCEICKTTCFLSAVTCECKRKVIPCSTSPSASPAKVAPASSAATTSAVSSATPSRMQSSNISNNSIESDQGEEPPANNNEKLACLRHYTELCDKCRPNQHILKYRYTLDELPLMIRKLKVKAEAVELWLNKVKKVFDPNQNTAITLEELQEITREAVTKKFPNSLLLERLQSAVLEAEKCVTVIQQLHISNVRQTPDLVNSDKELANYKLTLDELELFVQEIDNLYCVIKEGQSVRELKKMGDEFDKQASQVLNDRITNNTEKEIEELIKEGQSLCIELPQIAFLKARLQQIQWLSKSRQLRGKTSSNTNVIIVGDLQDNASNKKITLEELESLYDEGCKLQPNSYILKEVAEIADVLKLAQEWEIQAYSILNSNNNNNNTNARNQKSSLNMNNKDDTDDELLELSDSSEFLSNKNDGEHKSSFNNKKPSFTQRPNQLNEIHDLLHRAGTIPVILSSENNLREIVKQAKEWHRMVEEIQKNENYPYYHTLENIVAMGKRIPIKVDNIDRMEEHLALAKEWKNRTSEIFIRKNSNFKLMEILIPRTKRVLNDSETSQDQQANYIVDDIGAAQMINEFKIDGETELKELKLIRQQNLAKSFATDNFCVCKSKYFGVMYNCQLCKDWFHVQCVPPVMNVSRSMNKKIAIYKKAIENDIDDYDLTHDDLNREIKYLCNDCKRSSRPRLEIILELLVSLQRLAVRVPEGEALQVLTERAMSWQDRARQALAEDDVVTVLARVSSMKQRVAKKSKNTFAAKVNSKMNKKNALRLEEPDNSMDNDIHYSDDNLNTASFVAEHPTDSSNSSSNNPPVLTSDKSLHLSSTIRNNLEMLMIEGELLEVSLDETQHIWRVLNAVQPNESTLNLNIADDLKISSTNEGLVTTNNRKRKIENSLDNNLIDRENSATSLITINSKVSKTSTASKRIINRKQILTTIATLTDPAFKNLVLQCNNSINNTENEQCVDQDDADNPVSKLTKSRKNITRGRKMNTKVTNNSSLERNVINKKRKSLSDQTSGNPVLLQKKKQKLKGRDITKNEAKKINDENLDDDIIDDETSSPLNTICKSAVADNLDKISISKNENNDEYDDIEDEDGNDGNVDDDDEEEEECSAVNCARPMGTEVDWVQCDGGCNNWFHMFCVGIIKCQIKPDDDYICKKCKPKRSRSKPTISSIPATLNNTNKTEDVIPIGTKKKVLTTKQQISKNSKKRC